MISVGRGDKQCAAALRPLLAELPGHFRSPVAIDRTPPDGVNGMLVFGNTRACFTVLGPVPPGSIILPLTAIGVAPATRARPTSNRELTLNPQKPCNSWRILR